MKKGFTLRELASITKSDLVGDPDHIIEDVEDLKSAKSQHLAFFASEKYVQDFKDSDAGAILIRPQTPLLYERNYLINEDPSKAFQIVVGKLHEDDRKSGFTGIHPTAVVHQSARIGKDVQIGPFAVIDCECDIGAGTTIASHTYIGPECIVGENCTIGNHVVLQNRTKIGDRVRIQSSTVLGGWGFNHQADAAGVKRVVPHYGYVEIEEDAEIGSNATIDRGRFKATKIGKRAKVDCMVMIAHNVEMGEDTTIVSQSGIAGSTKIGKNVTIAAQVGIAGHLEIEDHTVLGARAGVRSSVKKGIYTGVPLQPLNQSLKTQVIIRNLPRLLERIKSLESQVKELQREEISCP